MFRWVPDKKSFLSIMFNGLYTSIIHYIVTHYNPQHYYPTKKTVTKNLGLISIRDSAKIQYITEDNLHFIR